LRVRQAAFDILLHAPWGGAEFLRGARVLDVFAGTGALGLEALSRGVAGASFIENARPALEALRTNIAACNAEDRCRIIRADALAPPPGAPHQLVFLDPPYGRDFVALSLVVLSRAGWIGEDTIVMAELGPGDALAAREVLAERRHGKARLVFCRMGERSATHHPPDD
jgi:16S rRNA (guanine966-N2)-methyltransferase